MICFSGELHWFITKAIIGWHRQSGIEEKRTNIDGNMVKILNFRPKIFNYFESTNNSFIKII